MINSSSQYGWSLIWKIIYVDLLKFDLEHIFMPTFIIFREQWIYKIDPSLTVSNVHHYGRSPWLRQLFIVSSDRTNLFV